MKITPLVAAPSSPGQAMASGLSYLGRIGFFDQIGDDEFRAGGAPLLRSQKLRR